MMFIVLSGDCHDNVSDGDPDNKNEISRAQICY